MGQFLKFRSISLHHSAGLKFIILIVKKFYCIPLDDFADNHNIFMRVIRFDTKTGITGLLFYHREFILLFMRVSHSRARRRVLIFRIWAGVRIFFELYRRILFFSLLLELELVFCNLRSGLNNILNTLLVKHHLLFRLRTIIKTYLYSLKM